MTSPSVPFPRPPSPAFQQLADKLAPQDLPNARSHPHARGSSSLAASGFSSRPHAHSVSLGSLRPEYRVNRRKSSSSMAGINMAALAAAAKDASADHHSNRVKHEGTIEGLGISAPTGSTFESPVSDKTASARTPSRAGKGSSAVVDGPPLSSMLNSKAKARRASEGARLIRGERRRSAAGELRCETCGKGYKHGSCLTKHLWEHTPEWALTSKLLISKHQQVQLLEAASVLVGMNLDGPTPPAGGNESAIQDNSDLSSESPAASGSSDPREDDEDDEEDSSRTSTPSQDDEMMQWKGTRSINRPSRQDSYSTWSHRSSFGASSAPTEATDLYYYRQSNSSRRPSTASRYDDGSEHQDVKEAAEGLVSCSLGTTPKTGPTQLPPDVPPVPPLPAKFARKYGHSISQQGPHVPEVEMTDDRSELKSRGRGDEHEEGFFGRMDH